jgi:hypothetical protein
MTAEMRCEQVRELAAELALGIATGVERDAALRHLSDCSDCRGLVSELSSVGEEILRLTPAREPPAGFEARVLDALAEQAEPRRPRARPHRRRLATALALAATFVLAALVGGGSAFLATGADRRLAESYRAVLREGQGSFFAAAPLAGPDGRIGTVFGYEGRPPWIMVTLQAAPAEQDLRVLAVTREGDSITLGDAVLGGDADAWGHRLPVGLSALRELRFVGPDGQTALVAVFDAASPWA